MGGVPALRVLGLRHALPSLEVPVLGVAAFAFGAGLHVPTVAAFPVEGFVLLVTCAALVARVVASPVGAAPSL